MKRNKITRMASLLNKCLKAMRPAVAVRIMRKSEDFCERKKSPRTLRE